MKVGIVDYGAGNYQSVVRAFEELGVTPLRIFDAQSARQADVTHLVFPGVGRASQAMKALTESGLDLVIRAHAAQNKPLLGICVGMQVLGRHSEEDDTKCLGLLNFRLRQFKTPDPVPHMGWNTCEFHFGHRFAANALLDIFPKHVHFYFVHSFAAFKNGAQIEAETETSPECVIGTTTYGGLEFASVVGLGNIIGTQFHVEKSGVAGLEFLKYFLRFSGEIKC